MMGYGEQGELNGAKDNKCFKFAVLKSNRSHGLGHVSRNLGVADATNLPSNN